MASIRASIVILHTMISAPQCDITVTVSIIAWDLCHVGNKKLSVFFFFFFLFAINSVFWDFHLFFSCLHFVLGHILQSSLSTISLCNISSYKIFLCSNSCGPVLWVFWISKSLIIFSFLLCPFPNMLAESRSVFGSCISSCSCCGSSCLVELCYFGILALHLARVASSSIHVPLMRRVIQSPLK